MSTALNGLVNIMGESMSKSKIISTKTKVKAQIRKALLECIPDPESVFLKIILDLNDPSYCELRAIEMINEARQSPNNGKKYHDGMIKSTLLLTIARILRGYNHET